MAVQSFSRHLLNCFRAVGLILALNWLATPRVHAQIIYASDNRSISAKVGLDTNSFSLGGLASVSYSGDYSGSGSPSSPYADFNNNLSGSVNISTAYQGVTNSYYANVGAYQASYLTPLGITYSSGVREGDNLNTTAFTQVQESSYLQVSFMVATATPYSLTCTRGIDPYFSAESWSLNSANLGNLVSGPPYTYTGVSEEGTFTYSGMFSPGDVYTLTLQENAFIHDGAPNFNGPGSGDLQVTLAVPEPKSSLLLAVGMFFLIAVSQGRKSRKQFQLLPARARSRNI